MILQSKCRNVITGMFGGRWLRTPMPKQGILRNVDALYKREGEVGYSTNGYLVIEDLIKRKEIVDKVMLFTDTQMYDSNGRGNSFENTWNRYKVIAPNAKLYLLIWQVMESSQLMSEEMMYTLLQVGQIKFLMY